jgi:hypothetical protein
VKNRGSSPPSGPGSPASLPFGSASPFRVPPQHRPRRQGLLGLGRPWPGRNQAPPRPLQLPPPASSKARRASASQANLRERSLPSAFSASPSARATRRRRLYSGSGRTPPGPGGSPGCTPPRPAPPPPPGPGPGGSGPIEAPGPPVRLVSVPGGEEQGNTPGVGAADGPHLFPQALVLPVDVEAGGVGVQGPYRKGKGPAGLPGHLQEHLGDPGGAEVETFSPGLGPTRRSTVSTNRILSSTLTTRPRWPRS